MNITLRYRSRVMVYAAILFVATFAAAIAMLTVPKDPRGYIYGAVVMLLFSGVALFVFLKERKRYRKTIVISPEGIKTEDGELVKAESFHKEVNAIKGMPLFVDPIIEHL